MYTLYSAENSYSMTAQVMLEELGLEYKLKWVDIHIPIEDKDKEWIAYNPNGRVPTLVSAEGVLYETAAILVSLAENHPQHGLIPPVNDPMRPLYWQWHFYLMSTMQPESLILDSPDHYFEDEKCQDALRNSASRHMSAIWRVIDESIGEGQYFLGDRFSTVDISFAMQACWKESQPAEGLDNFPNAVRVLQNVLSRPSVVKVLKEHKVEAIS